MIDRTAALFAPASLLRFGLSIGFALIVGACSGAVPPSAPTTGPQVVGPALPTIAPAAVTVGAPATRTPVVTLSYTDPARTAMPASGPTLAGNPGVSLRFADAAPATIGRWSLNKNTSYVDKAGHGAVLFYSGPGLGDIQVSFFLIYTPEIPVYNTSNAIDRFNKETSLIEVEKIPVNIGDRAIIAPTNRKRGAREGINPTVLAEMQFRNTVIVVYATPSMLDKNTSFSADEAREFLQKMYEAIPKP
jgi:hypothetical protein